MRSGVYRKSMAGVWRSAGRLWRSSCLKSINLGIRRLPQKLVQKGSGFIFEGGGLRAGNRSNALVLVTLAHFRFGQIGYSWKRGLYFLDFGSNHQYEDWGLKAELVKQTYMITG